MIVFLDAFPFYQRAQLLFPLFFHPLKHKWNIWLNLFQIFISTSGEHIPTLRCPGTYLATFVETSSPSLQTWGDTIRGCTREWRRPVRFVRKEFPTLTSTGESTSRVNSKWTPSFKKMLLRNYNLWSNNHQILNDLNSLDRTFINI